MGILADERPELLDEWNYKKNGELTPSDVSTKSGKSVWWKCKEGHEWQAKIYTRSNGSGCPFCSGNKVLAGYNDLATVCPQLGREWHPTKNGDIRPSDVTAQSNKKVWWKGKCGHEWEAKIQSRYLGNNCPICASQVILPGYNDLKTINPVLAQEWHPDKNGDLKPSMYAPQSQRKVWWLGKCGHEWKTSIAHRANGRECPVCANKKIVKGINDLVTVNPQLGGEWHPNKNGDLRPSMVSAQSHKKVWWLGKCGHEWNATIRERNRGTDCPICSNQIILSGYNDLKTVNPMLAKEWHPTKNGDLNPSQVAPKTTKKVWWLGKCNHEWCASIASRANGNGCPICSNQIILPGYNDLMTVNPTLAKEWHPTRNGKLKPSMYAPQSQRKVWWLGKCGHEWSTSIALRTNGRGCPICIKEWHSSFPEQAILYYLKNDYPDIINNDISFGIELDIYIPSLKIAIEYDGYAWHKNREENDKKKNVLCKEHGIKLIRVREEGLKCFDDCFCIVRKNCRDIESINDVIKCLIMQIRNNICDKDIDVERDETDIYAEYIISKKKNSLAHRYPAISKEWNYDKNGYLKPEMFFPKSGKKVWWKCDTGHEWKTAISCRTQGRKCPICSNKRIVAGINDLATINPKLAREWNYDKNKELYPSQVAPKSSKKVWWKCGEGHEWQATINDRAYGTGCPVCRRKSIVVNT